MSVPRGRRLLTDAEIEIWLKVAQTVVPRPDAVLPRRKVQPAPPEPVPAPPPGADEAPKRRGAGHPATTVPPKPRPTQLAPFEKRYRQKVTRGRVAIEGAIDLHGMTQAQAHRALDGFLRSAQRGGSRLVLVVTGKGRARSLDAGPDPQPGVLRRAVPNWLRAVELRSVVLGFEEAGLPHGGLGALYVRLRKPDP